MKTKLFILSALMLSFNSCGENKEEKKDASKETPIEETKGETESGEEMKYVVKEVDVASDWVVSVTTKISIPEVSIVLGSSYGAIFSFLSESKIEMGIPRAYFHNWIDINSPFDMEAAIPVTDSTIKLKSPLMKLRKTYSGKALKVVYFGPYENTNGAYDAIDKYMAENNLTNNGSPWEVYMSDPGVETDPMKVQTDIYMPVK